MAWARDTDYEPAYTHFGYAAAIFTNGTDSIIVPERLAGEVVGWRSACGCGWRGDQFYPRSEFSSPDGKAPEQVEGYRQTAAAYAEWEDHLARALPELDVHDLAKVLGKVQTHIREAVRDAERAGVPRSRILEIVEQAGARISFPDRVQGSAPTAGRGRPAAPQPAPRRPEPPAPGR